MPEAARVGDLSKAETDAHGCPACPHTVQGPAILGSPNVLINNMPAVRVTDIGMHAACCGPNMWNAVKGSSTVLINGLAAHRKGDMDQHCGGVGKMIQGSPDVIIGG
ncbi:MAG TPA: PAAR domain-containing protein [Myxococcota bacterium]|nr:PAAR domain-containing protein [Myxococcota bacterium]